MGVKFQDFKILSDPVKCINMLNFKHASSFIHFNGVTYVFKIKQVCISLQDQGLNVDTTFKNI